MDGGGGVTLMGQGQGRGRGQRPESTLPRDKKLLWLAVGLVVGTVVVALAIYMGVTYSTIGRHASRPQDVVAVIDLQRRAHWAIGPPKGRVAAKKLPPGVRRTSLSHHPVIDQFDGVARSAARDPAVAVATAVALVGLGPEYAEAPTALLDQGNPVPRVAYLRAGSGHGKGIANQRLVTVVLFQDHGGGLRFPYFPHDVPAAAGRAVAWVNVAPDGHVDPRTQFLVLPGTTAAVVHFRDRPALSPAAAPLPFGALSLFP